MEHSVEDVIKDVEETSTILLKRRFDRPSAEKVLLANNRRYFTELLDSPECLSQKPVEEATDDELRFYLESQLDVLRSLLNDR